MAKFCLCGVVDVNVGFRICAPFVYSRKRPGNPPCTTFLESLRQAAEKEALINLNQASEGEGSAALIPDYEESLEVQIEVQPSQADVPPDSNSPNGDGLLVGPVGEVLASALLTLTDPDVLDCPICLYPLSLPVYQCKNGHISCADCFNKMNKKCAQCRARIGYSRCRAIENVIESLTSPCRYKQQGCNATVKYSNKLDHEKSCKFGPCTCPHTNCDRVTTYAQLYFHFRSIHSQCTNEFLFNKPIFIPLVKNQKDVYFQEGNEGTLFILHRNKDKLFTLLCVGPTSPKGGFSYHLFARYGMSSVEIKSIAANISGKVLDPLPPSDFLGARTKCMYMLRLTIWSREMTE